MKYFLGFALVFLCAAAGYKITEKYKIRKEVFDSLLINNACVMAAVAAGERYSDIISSFPTELKATFKGAEALATGERFTCLNKALSPRQRHIIERYAELLGESGKEGQKEVLTAFGKQIESEKKEVDECFKKAEGTGVKIGIAAGMMAFLAIV